MGRFIYKEGVRAEFEDRTLAHLQAAIAGKLRRGESFFFTWKTDDVGENNRISVWIHVGADLVFKYYGSRTPAMNRAWVEALTHVANTPAGLHLVPEPDQRTVDEVMGRST